MKATYAILILLIIMVSCKKEKPDPIARTIRGFIGYAAFIEKMRAI